MTEQNAIVDYIKSQKPGFIPRVGLVLGSGLGSLGDEIKDSVKIPFSTIPAFPKSSVAGHKGQLILGTLGNMPIACMQGRVHGYEGAESSAFKLFIRTLKLLGCEMVFITNASGSLRQEVGPGQLMMISDHVNFSHRNPLIGMNEDEFGERFHAMDNAYDPQLRKRLHDIAKKINIPLAEGVYMGVTGPSFETPAEIRAYKLLGADCIGMSTVPEVIIARHCGLRVAAIASITNFGVGMQEESLTHEGTLHYGQIAAKNLSKLITETLESLHREPC
ncbi:MAG: purine-nucleoside phosphorylase [Gammaproteobacteria bacterium]|nr:purine-nucleoside phosphorylase [Gammaproteobacteria bacterium]